MELLYFILSCFGITQIITKGTLFNKLRQLGKFWGCPMCIGFWVGVFLWGINDFTALFTFDNSILTGFLLGCLSSGTSYILCQSFGDEGIKHELHNQKVDVATSKTLLQG